MTRIDMEVKTELKEKILVYPVEKINGWINEVAKRLFEKEIDVLKRERYHRRDLLREQGFFLFYSYTGSSHLIYLSSFACTTSKNILCIFPVTSPLLPSPIVT